MVKMTLFPTVRTVDGSILLVSSTHWFLCVCLKGKICKLYRKLPVGKTHVKYINGHTGYKNQSEFPGPWI